MYLRQIRSREASYGYSNKNHCYLLLAFVLQVKTWATITETNFAACIATTGYGGASSCSNSGNMTANLTITGGRGALLVVDLGSNISVSSITGGGTWTHGCGLYTQGESIDVWYNTNTTSASSINIAPSLSGNGIGWGYFEFSPDAGYTFSLDQCSGNAGTYSGTSLSGVNLGTLAGTDAILQGAYSHSSITAVTSGWTALGTSGQNFAFAYKITNSGSAPTWTTTTATNANYVVAAIAMKETSVSSALHLLNLLGVGQ